MCTHFEIHAADSSIVVGRSMEFGLGLGPSFYVHGREARCAALDIGALSGIEGAPSRYGYVGISVSVPLAGRQVRLPGVADGVNEKGLSAGCLWMPGTVYPKVTEPRRATPVTLLNDLVLGRCATIADVKALLPEHQFWLPEEIASDLPLHFPIADAHGGSIVVEFLGGEMRIHDNTVGVCTNAPEFPWQITNLANYLNLTPHDTAEGGQTLGRQLVTPTGHGTGLTGLPGYATPPARFVRTAYLKQYAMDGGTIRDAGAASNLAIHLLNSVDIPLNTVQDPVGKKGGLADYTQWVVVKDLTHRTIAVRTYATQMFRGLELGKIDFDAIRRSTIALGDEPEIVYLDPPRPGGQA